MTFGKASGPPATAKQLAELLALLNDAGHRDFRDARGPLGFTQRQAAGRFTRDEAEELIERLRDESTAGDGPTPPSPAIEPRLRPTSIERALQQFSSEQLAAELQRRGWVVLEP